MIRAVANKRLDLSDSEYEYYNLLVEKFGSKGFSGLFSTNRDGVITSITPPVDNTVNIGIIYFVLNVMMNQRIRTLDHQVKNISENVANLADVAKIVVRVERIEAALFGGENDETS